MTTIARRSPSLLVHGAVLLFYLELALVITYPLVTVLGTRFAGHPFSDSYELARHIWWLAHALQTGQPLFETPLLAYPDGLSGALLWAYPLQSWPAALFALALALPAAFNLSLLLTLALNGWAVWLLARTLTGDDLAGLVAGTIFLAYPTFQGHLAAGHTGLLALWPAALYATALLRLRAAPERRWVLLSGVLLAMCGWGSTQLLIFTAAPLTAAFGLTLLAERNQGALLRLVAAVAGGGLLALVFALPLLRETLAEPAWVRLQTGVVDYSADLLAVVAPSFMHPLYRNNPLSGAILGVDPFEATAYVGLIAGGLALLGVWRRRAARWWLALALVGWVFSLGPLLRVGGAPLRLTLEGYSTGVVLPWAALYDLPVLNIIRTPGRFNFLVALAVALKAAYGLNVVAGPEPPRGLGRGRLGNRGPHAAGARAQPVRYGAARVCDWPPCRDGRRLVSRRVPHRGRPDPVRQRIGGRACPRIPGRGGGHRLAAGDPRRARDRARCDQRERGASVPGRGPCATRRGLLDQHAHDALRGAGVRADPAPARGGRARRTDRDRPCRGAAWGRGRPRHRRDRGVRPSGSRGATGHGRDDLRRAARGKRRPGGPRGARPPGHPLYGHLW